MLIGFLSLSRPFSRRPASLLARCLPDFLASILGGRVSCRAVGSCSEADVRGAESDFLCDACRWPKTRAVVLCAQVGAALDDPHRHALLSRVKAGCLPCLLCVFAVARVVPAGGPFPDIAGHIVQPGAIRREAAGRRGAGMAIFQSVLGGEISLLTAAAARENVTTATALAADLGGRLDACSFRVLRTSRLYSQTKLSCAGFPSFADLSSRLAPGQLQAGHCE